jgi:hypothetical protein
MGTPDCGGSSSGAVEPDSRQRHDGLGPEVVRGEQRRHRDGLVDAA